MASRAAHIGFDSVVRLRTISKSCDVDVVAPIGIARYEERADQVWRQHLAAIPGGVVVEALDLRQANIYKVMYQNVILLCLIPGVYRGKIKKRMKRRKKQ